MIETLAVVVAIAMLGLALRWEIRRRRLQTTLEYFAAYRLGAKHQGESFVVIPPEGFDLEAFKRAWARADRAR